MRKKVLKLVITFEDTKQALRCEDLCEKEGIAGRLIPLPNEIAAGCGLAWKTDIEQNEKIKNFFQEKEIKNQGFYEIYLFERCNTNE